jgi:hypothetical protein
MKRVTLSLIVLLLLSCNFQPKISEKRESSRKSEKVAEKAPKPTKYSLEDRKPKKVVLVLDEDQVAQPDPEAFYIREGGDILEFDEEGNPIE